MTFDVRPDRRLIRPAYRSNRFVLVEIDAPPARREHGRPPVNLAFVLDRSGSMGGQKIALAKQAVEDSIARLHDDDRFASSSTTTDRRRRPGAPWRPPRPDGRRSTASAGSTPAAAPTSAKAGCAAASRWRCALRATASTAACC